MATHVWDQVMLAPMLPTYAGLPCKDGLCGRRSLVTLTLQSPCYELPHCTTTKFLKAGMDGVVASIDLEQECCGVVWKRVTVSSVTESMMSVSCSIMSSCVMGSLF